MTQTFHGTGIFAYMVVEKGSLHPTSPIKPGLLPPYVLVLYDHLQYNEVFDL